MKWMVVKFVNGVDEQSIFPSIVCSEKFLKGLEYDKWSINDFRLEET